MIAWLLTVALAVVVWRLRRRLELVARAEHELRGPLTAFALGAQRAGAPWLEAELERARAALADLTAARAGRRAAPLRAELDVERLVRSSAAAWGARVDWQAGAARGVTDGGRLAQAVGNLLSNAAEHGDGEVIVTAVPAERGLRLDVMNRDRGRGLAIAAAAARDAGARLALERGPTEFRASLDLPLGR